MASKRLRWARVKAFAGVLIAGAVGVAACGRVITPVPTVQPSPSPFVPAVGGVATLAVDVTPTPLLLPPADTVVPLPTPTPLIHVVAEGDTLYTIAFQYGVNPETLQRINGIENPNLLSIGQELIIPVGSTAGGPSSLLLPTPTPLPFSVQGTAFYETPVGSLWYLGEVLNTTAVTLTNVQLQVVLYDSGGQPLAVADTFAALDLIPPGGRSPFGVLFTAPPAGWVSAQVTIIRGEAAGELEAAYVPLGTADLSGQPAEGQFQVSGTVRNLSPERSAVEAYVVVTTYGADGAVTGFRLMRLPLEGPLAPGAAVPFQVAMGYHGEDVPSDFSVGGLGRVETG